MNTAIILSIAFAATTILALLRVIALKRKQERTMRLVRRLERSVQKLTSHNGKLWYDLVQAQSPSYNRIEQTGFTVTKQ